MGTGKLAGRQSSRKTDAASVDDGLDDEDRTPLSIAEIVSELMYSGKPLSEIAGYDDVIIFRIIGRHRDQYGKLVRDNGLPSGVEVDENGMRVIRNPMPFTAMLRDVWESRGLERSEALGKVDEYLAENPKLGRGGDG